MFNVEYSTFAFLPLLPFRLYRPFPPHHLGEMLRASLPIKSVISSSENSFAVNPVALIFDTQLGAYDYEATEQHQPGPQYQFKPGD
jgi:hypothetical protein